LLPPKQQLSLVSTLIPDFCTAVSVRLPTIHRGSSKWHFSRSRSSCRRCEASHIPTCFCWFDPVLKKLSNSIDVFDYFPLISGFCSSVSAHLCSVVRGSLDRRFSRSRSSCILDRPWAWRQSFRRCDLSTRCLICSSTCGSAYIIYNPTFMYTSILLQASRLFQ
jgi:hypothetical protein